MFSKFLFFVCEKGVLAAVALKDKLTGNILEMWWNGTAAESVVCFKNSF